MNFSSVLTLMVIALLGAISPGPDFAIVTRNCLSGKFRVGVLTSLGIASALVIHLSYCILGIALLISQSSFLYYTLKYAGAAYLLYLGILMLKDKTSPEGSEENLKPFLKSKKRYPPFVSGFLCNLLNPKATLFILSIFTQYISPDTSLGVKVALGSLFPIISFLWFTALSYMLTHHLLQKHFQGFQVIITKIMGVFLCLLAICVAFT